MTLHSQRSRIVVAAAILCISILLMGCNLYNAFINFANDYDVPGQHPAPEEQADAPAAYYESEETADPQDGSVVFDNQNLLAVQNGGTSPSFSISSETIVTKIETYHWNDASGNAATGEISLRADNGTVYGPWTTEGRPGQGDVPNAYWAASPNVTLAAGSYTVIDSDPSTWSQNADSGGEGFTLVYAQSAE